MKDLSCLNKRTLMHSFSHMPMFIADFFFAMSLYVSSLVLYPSFLIHWSCLLPAKENIFSTSHQYAFKAILSIFIHFYCIPLSPPPNIFNLMIGIFGVYQKMGNSILHLLFESFPKASLVEFAFKSI